MYDAIVVGAGIEGSSTAYQLVKNGQKTLLLEQFPLPHSRGSSHGQSRIIRKAYGGQEHFTRLMKEAYILWEQLEQESGTSLYLKTGCLALAPSDHDFFSKTVSSLSKHNIPYETLNHARLREKYPMISFPSNFDGVIDKDGGIIRSDKALQTYQSRFIHYGGELHDCEPFVSITPGNIVTVKTTKSEYKTKRVILTVGPWITKILPTLGVHFPLKVQRVTVLYWKEKIPGQFSSKTFPVLLDRGHAGIDHDVYLLPSFEYPGHVKVCLHYGPDVDPDERDAVDDSWVKDIMKKYIETNIPGLESTPSIVESCLYTISPDDNFILDRHPTWKNVIIGAGFSGRGFKLAPVIGKMLADLAMDNVSSYDMSQFKIDRFTKKAARL